MATICCGEHLFENISAVIFDKDGTLANVEDYLLALARERVCQIEAAVPGLATDLMAAMGLYKGAIMPTGLMAIASRHETEIAAAAYVAATGKGWIESRAIVKTAFERAKANMSAQAAQTPLLPGGRSLMARLRSVGVKVGIVSADSHAAVGEFIAQYDLTCYVDWYRGASAEMPDKTASGALSLASRSLDRRLEQILVIGDSATDWSLAQQGAAGFVAMVGGWRAPLTVPKATVTVHRLSQVECFD